ncbi:phospholipid-transporting ATPase ABCA1 [Condylostylus longicornis]|uniref:phospholipid-transporting ATPase ABCA1 n=1 Tax=Condylostylus longicornis TaxID=2530218 RepID=UPI00244E2ADE|nr:phospholipid-transporting ATPase ABCA1 [Condylostylus longicornis]
MKICSQTFSLNQIKALLRKDLLIRLRQPWMLIAQIIWPIIIFSALYSFRNRFQPKSIPDCQYPTRQLPSKDNLLPFLHSYVCTIENKCMNVTQYEEVLLLDNAPAKPIVDIFQLIISDNDLVDTISDLPNTTDWVGTVLTLIQSPKFNDIQENISKFVSKFPQLSQLVAGDFNISLMFSDSQQFAKTGLILCGHKFPEDNFIRIVRDIVYGEDETPINQDELDAMPTPYCKKLYLDVSSTRRGKLTWSQVKPIIQGKIIYGPTNNETSEIMKHANTTFDDINNLRKVFEGLHLTRVRLNTDKDFEKSFDDLLELAKSPLVKLIAGDIDVDQIAAGLKFIKTDKTFAEVIETLFHILECFAVDRYIPVETEFEFEEVAFDLNRRRQFYAGVWFNKTKSKDVIYRLRVDTDNTPVTIETHNRFWFPGPMDSMAEDLKYHRGFVQIKQALDTGIIRYKKSLLIMEKETMEHQVSDNKKSAEDELEKFLSWEDDDFNSPSTTEPILTSSVGPEYNISRSTTETSIFLNLLGNAKTNNTSSEKNISNLIGPFEWDEDFDGPFNGSSKDESTTTISSLDIENVTDPPSNVRKKRQFDFFNMLFGGDSNSKSKKDESGVDDIKVYTKQFPYPSYIKDDFKRGLYLGQAVQMSFFFALMIQIATCVRYRIWMKESKNTMVMRSMGLKASSEILAWIFTTFIEILVIFLIACLILYVGAILEYTSFVFIILFLILFGLCTISFCYMCSTIFASASIGSVASAILFLMTFLPYIIIICLDTKLSKFMTFIVNLSLSTSFCYAWEHVMRQELQATGMSYGQAFNEGLEGEFTYGVCMLILDGILYAIIGYVIETYYKNDDDKYYRVDREDLDPSLGALMENVTKVYNNEKVAISNISLTFPKDEITCLLGRNGAGKSTIIKMLTGQITQTNGKVVISQALSDRNEPDKVGFCSQDNVLIPQLTAKEHLLLYSRIKVKKNFEAEVEKTMQSLNFGKYEDFQANQLSGGYQRRLCVAIAFIGSPNLVILDEPCSGVDTKARKCVWELVEKLRKGRAVVLATHYLDEAEFMSDKIIIIHNGQIISRHSPESLKNLITKSFILSIKLNGKDPAITEKIHEEFKTHLKSFTPISANHSKIEIEVIYDPILNDYPSLFDKLEDLQAQQRISDIVISSNSLDQLFANLNKTEILTNGSVINSNGNSENYEKIDLTRQDPQEFHNSISRWELIKNLFKKRLIHFSRNLKLLICVLVLPALFEIIAMSFVELRPGGEFDTPLNLTRNLYPETSEFFSIVKPNNFTELTYNKSHEHCDGIDDSFACFDFKDSYLAYKWLLETDDLYRMNRYGGLTFNKTSVNVWYNNKGYHSMVSWQNDLNTMMLRSEMKDDEYGITTYNHPLKLGERELSASSILQQVSDAGIAFILLIAFSLVVASASVYIVNERVSGEKLQQKLCGVDNLTYWGVALVWDLLIYLLAVLICVVILYIYSFPIYVDRSQMNGIVLLLVLFGFATIPAVYVFEKLFSEASFANMTIFCLNVTIALTTLTIITVIDVLGETDTDVWWRNFLNRLFLIFPQHALSDALIEICKNYILGEVMRRFDIETYKSPVSSPLLARHYVALTLLGIIFLCLNYLLESGKYHEISSRICALFKSQKTPLKPVELKIVSIQNSLTRDDKSSSYAENYAVKVDSIWKSYGAEYAVRDVSFYVQTGECFGLLGKNGAGKSTVFKILSGQIHYDSGNVHFLNKEISYCPQTIALDPLLSVEEVIKFYSKLRRVKDAAKCVEHLLLAFNLESYRKVLVKNLSGGNRRKLNVAVCCIGNSSVVLMDEPTADMDPVTRSLVYKVINGLLEEQKSVLLTSHSITEIDKVCQRIAVIKEGQIISCGTPQQLEQKYGGYYNVVIFLNKTEVYEMQKNIVVEFPDCTEIQVHQHSIKFMIRVQNTIEEKSNSKSQNENSISLSNLFAKINRFSAVYDVRYALSRCRLDVIFEKILDSNEIKNEHSIATSSFNNSLIASRSDDGGYDHKSFIKTD